MIKSVTAIGITASMLLYGCEPAATFDQPQPANAKPLSSFPERLQGKYLADDQASIVTIADSLITRHYDFDIKVHKDSLGSSYKLLTDTLINLTAGTKEKISLAGDTMIQRVSWTDTLFNISNEGVLKKFKGYYFLNRLYNENAWETNMLSVKEGVLAIGNISGKEDIQKLKEITETTADTISTHFSLTRRQFKSFVRQYGFAEQETFILIVESLN